MSLYDDASLIAYPSGYKESKIYAQKPVPSYGAELVTNGDFATDSNWTKGTGWTISGGHAVHTGGGSYINQSIGLVVGSNYVVSFDVITSSGSGFPQLYMGGLTTAFTSNGSYSVNIVANATDATLGARFRGLNSCSIDNVSVKEILVATADLTFSRASSATRVNAEGLIETASVLGSEEVTNGDFATDSGWTKGTGWSISGGSANCDGTQTANSTVVQQNGVLGAVIDFVVGKTYKVNFDIIVTSGQISNVEVASGYDFSPITTSKNHTVYITAVSTNDRFTITANSSFIGSIDNVSVKEYTTSNVPRIDYSNGCGSLLLEPQRTNLVTYSEDFSNAYWTKSSINVTDGFVSPSGDLNASKFTEGSTNINHQIYRAISGTAGNTYTLSGFFKKGERDIVQLLFGGAAFNEGSVYCNFDLDNGVLGSGTYLDASITLISNGWYRCSFTATKTTTGNFNSTYCPKLTATSSRAAAYLGNGTSGIYAYGAQVELGSYPTSYIISNSGTSTTRIKDASSTTGLSSVINSTEGVLYVEISALADDGTSRDISINDGTSSNYVRISLSNASGNIEYNVVVSGSTQASGLSAITQTDLNKIALKYKLNDFALWVNGVEVLTDSSGLTFSASTLTNLSYNRGTGVNPFYGNVQNLMIFDSALTDEQLTDLTGTPHKSFNSLALSLDYTIL